LREASKKIEVKKVEEERKDDIWDPFEEEEEDYLDF